MWFLSWPQFLADQEFKLALIGLHGEKLPLPLVGTIHGLRPDVRLVVMGPDADDEVILQAITAGAKAYLEASATPQQVEQAIMIVSQGSIWAPRRVLSIFVDRATKPSRSAAPASAQFTARETEVLKLLVAARSNREIARTLGIEERTVKAHVAKLMRKVGVENRIALSIYAVTNSIVTPPPIRLGTASWLQRHGYFSAWYLSDIAWLPLLAESYFRNNADLGTGLLMANFAITSPHFFAVRGPSHLSTVSPFILPTALEIAAS